MSIYAVLAFVSSLSGNEDVNFVKFGVFSRFLEGPRGRWSKTLLSKDI